MRAATSLTALLAAALACQPAPPAAEPTDTSAEAKAAIDAANAKWAEYTAGGHSDSIAQFYAANAVLMPPNMPPVRGLDSIRAFFAVISTMSKPSPTLSVRAEQVWGTGRAAVEKGRWVFRWPATVRPPPGAHAIDSGKYLVRWVQQNGRWLMVEDIWNSDLAPRR